MTDAAALGCSGSSAAPSLAPCGGLQWQLTATGFTAIGAAQPACCCHSNHGASARPSSSMLLLSPMLLSNGRRPLADCCCRTPRRRSLSSPPWACLFPSDATPKINNRNTPCLTLLPSRLLLHPCHPAPPPPSRTQRQAHPHAGGRPRGPLPPHATPPQQTPPSSSGPGPGPGATGPGPGSGSGFGGKPTRVEDLSNLTKRTDDLIGKLEATNFSDRWGPQHGSPISMIDLSYRE